MKANASDPVKRKLYERKLRDLHEELVELQEWTKHAGGKVCIVFEGRDGAGKGGAIKAITERVSPRVFRVVALPPPQSASARRCMSSVICRTFRQPAKS